MFVYTYSEGNIKNIHNSPTKKIIFCVMVQLLTVFCNVIYVHTLGILIYKAVCRLLSFYLTLYHKYF